MEKHTTDDAMTIQQMAQTTGLSVHTLRYYERTGLMWQPVDRDDGNGYRAYTKQHVGWIEFIKKLRSTGMPIRDIRRYTELVQQGEETIGERMQLLKRHRSRVEAHMREVETHLTGITRKIAYYEEQDAQRRALWCGEPVLVETELGSEQETLRMGVR